MSDDPAPPDAPVVDRPPDREGIVIPAMRRYRIVVLALIAVVLGIVIFVLARRGSTHGNSGTGSGSGSTGAMRAPGGPSLPDTTGVRITGTIVDGAGMPVANAEVIAEIERGVPDKALSTTPSPSSSTADAGGVSMADAGGISIAGDGGAPSPTARLAAATAADGKFVIGGLEAGRYRLRVSGPGLIAAEVRYVPVPSDEIRIVVARQVKIEGKVVDGDTTVPNAYVGLRGEAIGGTIETRTDSQGAFHFVDLPEGRYQLFAWQNALAARAIRVNRLGAGPFEPIELRLESGTIVVGKVLDGETKTGIVAAVELRPIGDDQAPRYARSGDDGVFRIEGIPHGAWIADAFAPGYTSPGGIELQAGRGIPELSLVRGGMIEGRVLDGDGNVVANASVRAVASPGSAGARSDAKGSIDTKSTEYSAAVDQDKLRRFSGRMSAPAPIANAFTADPGFIPRGELGVTTGPIPPIPPPGAAVATRQASIAQASFVGEPEPLQVTEGSLFTTGADGRYRIRGLPKGKVIVLAVAPGFAEGQSKQLAIDAGKSVKDIDIVLTPGTFLVGKVIDQHGAAVVGAQVTAKPALGAPASAFTDVDGQYKLGPFAGKLDLVASAYGHADATKAIELAVARGTTPAERREDIVLVVADAILAGTVDDATGAVVAGATVELIGSETMQQANRRAVTGNDGTFSVDMLAEGSHRVRITHPDYPPVELEAAASPGARTRARLRIPLGGAAEGVLLDGASGAPIAGMAITGDGPGNASADATTDKAGQWKLGPLQPGWWKVVVKQPGYLPLSHDVDVPRARTPGTTSVRDIRLELQRGALVGGSVRDSRGQRVAGATVSVRRADNTGPTVEGTTDTQGEFRIHDAPTGDLVVTVTKGDATGTTRATIRPGDELLSLAIDLR